MIDIYENVMKIDIPKLIMTIVIYLYLNFVLI